MFKSAIPLFLLCETPLHAGSGSDLGVVDMPIQRERHTGFPKVESSGIKGALRECFEKKDTITVNGRHYDKKNNDADLKYALHHSFGPENGDEHAGSLGFSDARLLLFPVKSMKGVFAWITCPRVIRKFINELSYCGENGSVFSKPELPAPSSAPEGCQLYIKDDDRKIVLEEYTFEIINKNNPECSELARWLADQIFPGGEEFAYWRDKMKKDLVVLPDDDFADFVTMSTEVITRIKIKQETGTVQKGGLFTEEYLPSESILYSLALASPVFGDEKKGIISVFKQNGQPGDKLVLSYFKENVPPIFQLGGNATTGKGIVRIKLLEAKNDEKQ